MPLLPALGRKLLPKSGDSVELLAPEQEWEWRKKELGEKSKALDQLMGMVGLENVKKEFITIKKTIAAASGRKGKLRRSDFNLFLIGNPGTGKKTLASLYKNLLVECGVWSSAPCYEARAGFDFQADKDIESLHNTLRNYGDNSEVYIFIDSIEGMWSYIRADLLYTLERHAERLKLVVAITGNEEYANKFLSSRPSGRWHFPRRMLLKDYEDEQLGAILLQLISHNGFTVEGGRDGPYPRIAAKRCGRNRDSGGFSNVYELILAFEKMLDRQAARLEKERAVIRAEEEVAKKEKELLEAKLAQEVVATVETVEKPETTQTSDASTKTDTTSSPKGNNETPPEGTGDDQSKREEKQSDKKDANEEKPEDEKSDVKEPIDSSTPEPVVEKPSMPETSIVETSEATPEKATEPKPVPDLEPGKEPSEESVTSKDVAEIEKSAELEAAATPSSSTETTETEDKSAGDEKVEPETTVESTESTGTKKTEGKPAEELSNAVESSEAKVVEDQAAGSETLLADSELQEPVAPSKAPELKEAEKTEDKPAETESSAESTKPAEEQQEDKPTENKSAEPEKPANTTTETTKGGKPEDKPTDSDQTAETKPEEKPVEAEPPRPDPRYLTKEDVIGPEPEDIRHKSKAWQELDKMAGLEDVKKAIGELLTRAKANYRRELIGKEPLGTSLNRVFLGPPGTGKTTVARLYGQILADIGLLTTKEVVFKTPADFIGQYIGESEVKTSNILDSTIGKVLIIDDAHMFFHGSRAGATHEGDEFRLGCIDVLISKIHNKPGEDRCVILLGYTDMMEEMFQKVNPGLRRRFPLEEAFRFHSYDDKTLNEILRLKMAKEEITADKGAMEVAAEVLRRARDRPNFGNGGDVDNLLNQAKTRFRERTKAQSSTHSSDLPAIEAGSEEDILSKSREESHIVLQREDFDPEWNRGALASKKCQQLFEGLIGFAPIIEKFEGYQRMAANMRRRGKDPREIVPFTFIFKGPPGTGKTHTARIIGQIFYDMGFLSTSEVIECSASHLIGQYLGHTAPKVVNLFEKALGKVLFIDEAYRLGAGQGGTARQNSFEEEAVGELVDCMTKPRYLRKMIIVLAGYDKDMDNLMQVNAGLRGRFATEIVFPQMSASRAREHLVNLLKKEDIEICDTIDPGPEEKEKVLRFLHKLGMTPGWANARDIKTLAAAVTGSVYRNAVLDDDDDDDDDDDEGEGGRQIFRVSTAELNGHLKDMLRQRARG
ncbi:P-loop containing nucleoside triphosphate hydrolase protein [Podospora australis]|uniref:P-loop containing nucleoside triphosphate hydrolase protein n=1 Tax=Podospora australis TaxID=1536484 RepID=A0AAN6WS17_9PEZI|nr:P-loop containing nucleoside triphosphate hydrolase protein [Podospora australis]